MRDPVSWTLSVPNGDTAPPDSDPRLVSRAREGDPEALEALLVRNKERLQRLANQRLGMALREKVRSSDILQSTYLRVIKSIESFPGTTDDDFSNWVVRVLENTVRDQARYHRAEKRDRGRNAGTDVHDIDPAGDVSTPSAEVGLGEELQRIAQAMQRMPTNYARILTLHLDGDCTHRESAETLGCTESASRVMLARARARLLLELERTPRS